MAVSSGAGAHYAWINVGGTNYPITSGHVCQEKKKKTSRFNVTVPMSYPGALGTGVYDASYAMDSITHEFGMSGHTMHLLARTKVAAGN
jgi:hypothetical protein